MVSDEIEKNLMCLFCESDGIDDTSKSLRLYPMGLTAEKIFWFTWSWI